MKKTESEVIAELKKENQELRESFKRVKNYLKVRFDSGTDEEYQKAFNNIKKRLLLILEQEEK